MKSNSSQSVSEEELGTEDNSSSSEEDEVEEHSQSEMLSVNNSESAVSDRRQRCSKCHQFKTDPAFLVAINKSASKKAHQCKRADMCLSLATCPTKHHNGTIKRIFIFLLLIL